MQKAFNQMQKRDPRVVANGPRFETLIKQHERTVPKILNRTRLRAFVQNQHIRELTGARNT